MLDNLALFIGYAFMVVGGLVILFAALTFYVEISTKILNHLIKFLQWRAKEGKR